MTEAEWNGSVDPGAMFQWADGYVNVQIDYRRNAPRLNPAKARERLLRLWACGCCRLAWPLLADARSRAAVETAEKYADGGVSAEELAAAYLKGQQVGFRGPPPSATPPSVWDAYHCCEPDATQAAREVAREPSQGSAVIRAGLLRCVVGSPFKARPPLPWLPPDVVALAGAIYERRTWDVLPVLADMLEDSGVGDTELLGHLRGNGDHAKGCWVLDELLGKA